MYFLSLFIIYYYSINLIIVPWNSKEKERKHLVSNQIIKILLYRLNPFSNIFAIICSMRITLHLGSIRIWVILAHFRIIEFCLRFLIHYTPLTKNYQDSHLLDETYEHINPKRFVYQFQLLSFMTYWSENSIPQSH
jgi:hypothetical protein